MANSKNDKTSKVGAKNVTPEEADFIQEHEDGLSKTTARYAKWLHSTDEHADHDGQTLATQAHEVIRHWAEERDAVPATVPGTEHSGRPGVLRFIFNGSSDDDSKLEQIPWEEWFEPFDERELVFVFQEKLSSGDQSNFFMFDNPEREHE